MQTNSEAAQASLPPLVRPRALASFYGVSRATLYRWLAQGKHPQPLKLSAGVSAFRKQDVEQFLEDRAREAGEA